ncbi:TPA: hypothetical protein N0F65_002939 [Lagenidium giganteum]|uniref:RNase H type-1 domain-containing protein n=1 Tax=Lagenidium giganteum TaxID=4803 RepID=A0AAV2Z4F4_9STRA|nr:TPA: hypothetical protein N0F65_002939 [Lagenidium giganteum]
MLSGWSLPITKATDKEGDLAGLVAAATTPPEQREAELELVRPHKVSDNTPQIRPHAVSTWPKSPLTSAAMVATFDGSAKTKAGYSASAVGGTVNEAEYLGAIKAMEMALERGGDKLVLIGDSRLVMQQMRGEIDCNAIDLQALLSRACKLLDKFKWIALIHAKRV